MASGVSAPFIRRPIATTLLMIGVFLVGLAAYPLLPVAPLPQVDFPTIQVSANLPGASPETMASSVAQPLERQLAQIPGVAQMTSTSTQGETSITLQFELTRNLDAAAQDVESKISAAESQLPTGMPSPPSYQKVNPSDNAIIYIGMSSSTLPLATVDRYAETYLGERISMIAGVAQVQVYGSQKYAVRIQLDPLAMASRSIGINQVADAVRNANVDLPVGTLYGPHQAYTVQANGQLTDGAAYQSVIVAFRNGMPVRLNQVGHAFDSVQNNKVAGWVRGKRAVVLDIPLLFETKGEARVGTVVVVSAPRAIQIHRVARRRRMSKADVEAVIARQMPDREKRRRADLVVLTGLSRAHTLRVLRRFIQDLRA